MIWNFDVIISLKRAQITEIQSKNPLLKTKSLVEEQNNLKKSNSMVKPKENEVKKEEEKKNNEKIVENPVSQAFGQGLIVRRYQSTQWQQIL